MSWVNNKKIIILEDVTDFKFYCIYKNKNCIFFLFGMQINAKGIEQNKRLYVQIHGLPIVLAILIGATPWYLSWIEETQSSKAC